MSLFVNEENRPLSERLRPKTFNEVYGQDKIVGEDGLVSKLVKANKLTSLILWGPPGSGKTTIARVIANEYDVDFIEVSAVSMGKAEVRKAIDEAKNAEHIGHRTVLFVDEIHRFNKAQQDMFLPYVENGTIILIGATTENPSFEVISPLISRSRVIILEPLSEEDLVSIIKRGIKSVAAKSISPASAKLLAQMSQGDARAALNGLEVASSLAGNKVITKAHIQQAMQQVTAKYDKNGEMHYDVISAFIKSMRGSNEEAALYYLFRMLRAGEDPKFIARRMVIFASEDIGNASPYSLTLATSVFDAVERIGIPEAEYTLVHGVMYLCKVDKSRDVANALSGAKQMSSDFPNSPVPLHLRNAPTKLMKNLGYNKGYKWQADFKPEDGFLPEDITKLK